MLIVLALASQAAIYSSSANAIELRHFRHVEKEDVRAGLDEQRGRVFR